MAKSLSATRSKHVQLNLQSRRGDRGLSLEAIAETTKISIRFLQAIENEEFDKLPGGIFDRSYLRQYAAAIGFDETKLLAHYSKTHPDDSEQMVMKTPDRGFRRWFREAAAGRNAT